MDLNITEILEKLKAIESFATKVTETKKLADDLALNFARMKETINNALNEAFKEIADQIETLRRNMESMETMQASSSSSQASAPAAAPAEQAAPTPRTEPTATTPREAPEAPPAPPPAAEPTPAASTTPPAAAVAPPATEDVSPPAIEEAKSPELEVLEQKKEKLKAALTDLRFDYMRGYIPEEEYKEKEAELDRQLEEIDKQIAALK